MRTGVLGLAAAAFLLAACAGPGPTPRPASVVAPPGPGHRATLERAVVPPEPTRPPIAQIPTTFADLPGWPGEDHLAALAAVRATCVSSRAAAGPSGVCLRLAWLDAPTDALAREFLERNYRPVLIGEAGLLTGYFTPVYEAREAPADEFSAPVRPAPRGGQPTHLDRAEIESQPADDALAWMRPEDLFFLQIQGSGVLVFPSGARWRAVYAGSNSAPFSGIATPMRAQGLLGRDTSGAAIHDWLAHNRGPAAQAVMDQDRRYVFFRLERDDGAPPSGAAGVRLIPGRAVAIDPGLHRMGDLFWIDAQAPALPGAFPVYRRLVVALDIGSAIRGGARADLYLGEGDAAGDEAGRIRHVLRLYRLDPVDPSPP